MRILLNIIVFLSRLVFFNVIRSMKKNILFGLFHSKLKKILTYLFKRNINCFYCSALFFRKFKAPN